MTDRPKGVTLVAVLTSLGAIGNFFAAILLAALSSVGGPPPSGYQGLSIFAWVLIYSPLILSLVSFIVSIGMFSGQKYAWYLAMVLWIVSAVYYGFVTLFLPSNLKPAVFSLTLLVNVAFIVYFQSGSVKNYFLRSQT